ncbi:MULTISPECIES: RHS repeat-associated core domain-containing protein [unclassified Ruminococcus]|uniref:RHS repeat-associated core domain-containing protein n=1 Tax=unclassified Ruminococcus TaxID=2608920 RepID=UPI00210A7A47|nr:MULTISPECIES: RHS repeat-associated core domain-containing protein [unclassified Ruminococcus]MCQ4021697.1 hypothetical protein [Ruminococcus sp. zg-924]MCQ4114142.1 hypothetical protein [Ruminococcus sp. zg-921]
MLLYETRGEKYFHYYYDSNGTLCAVNYRLTPNGTEYVYYYTHNWRGDIVGIYNGNGDLKAKYTYDSWGNVTSIKDGNGNAITDPNHVGNLNPFRYRGYYMDTETGMYYLMSRYYDPVTHRFVNADDRIDGSTGILGSNVFAYCNNNPIINYDPNCHIRKYELDSPESYSIRNVILGATLIIASSVGIVLIAVDDVTVIGIMDDTAIPILFGSLCEGVKAVAG